jgi:hypothetical protein
MSLWIFTLWVSSEIEFFRRLAHLSLMPPPNKALYLPEVMPRHFEVRSLDEFINSIQQWCLSPV